MEVKVQDHTLHKTDSEAWQWHLLDRSSRVKGKGKSIDIARLL